MPAPEVAAAAYTGYQCPLAAGSELAGRFPARMAELRRADPPAPGRGSLSPARLVAGRDPGHADGRRTQAQGQQVAFLGLLDSYVPGTEALAADDWREGSAGLPQRQRRPGNPSATGRRVWSNATTSAPPSPSALASARPGREGWAATNWPRYSWSPGNSSNSPNWSCSPIRSGRCAGGRAGVVKRCGRCRGNWVVSLGRPSRRVRGAFPDTPHAQEVLDSLVEALEEIHGSLVYS